MLHDPAGCAWRSPKAAAAGLDDECALSVADWRDDARLSAADRAYLAFTEQFVTSVPHISPDEIEALLEHSDPERVYAFIEALYLMEMTERVDIVMRAAL